MKEKKSPAVCPGLNLKFLEMFNCEVTLNWKELILNLVFFFFFFLSFYVLYSNLAANFNYPLQRIAYYDLKMCYFCLFACNLGHMYWILYLLARSHTQPKAQVLTRKKERKWFELSLWNAFGISAMEKNIKWNHKLLWKIYAGIFHNICLTIYSFLPMLWIILNFKI